VTKEFAVTLKERVKSPNGTNGTTEASLNFISGPKTFQIFVYKVMEQIVKGSIEISK
jgi:hypothetical protein